MKRHTSALSRSLRSRLVLGGPLLLTLAGAVSACADTEPRELGFTQSTQDLTNVPDEPFFEEASQFVGRWVGPAEETLALTADGSIPAYRFPSGSSRIAVDLALVDGNLRGTVSFGEGAPLPVATDPNVGYPAGVAYDELLGYELNTVFEDGTPLNTLIRTHFTLPPFEGFPYQLENTSGTGINDGPLLIADGVASLKFSSFEPLQGWCELQTPYEGSETPGRFSCIPEYGGGIETLGDGSGGLCELYGPPITDGCLPDLSNIGECFQQGEAVEQVNCDKVTMCSNNFCSCDAETCWPTESNDRLTLRRVGNELVGLLENINFRNARGLNTPLGEVRFQRVE
jgi:hypothetical protein